jgi:cystathionine beta-lyase
MAAIVDRFPRESPAGVGHLGVLATVAAYTEGEPWLDQLVATLDDRRTLLSHRVRRRPWKHFLEKARVATLQGLHFGTPGSGHIRLNFATSAD